MQDILKLQIPYNIESKDVQKIITHHIIIELCELKKTSSKNFYYVFKKEEFNDTIIQIVNLIIEKMELNKEEKSLNFLKKFKKYLKNNGYNYIADVYLKQSTNKLALFR